MDIFFYEIRINILLILFVYIVDSEESKATQLPRWLHTLPLSQQL